MIVGLIPARGGSKGIPRKNLAMLGGSTLLAKGIALLQNSGCDRVFVSSEDDEILSHASVHGAEIVNRPIKISTDSASTESVILDAINQLNLGADDLLVTHQITSPFLTGESVRKCINALQVDSKLNSALVGLADHSFRWSEDSTGYWEPKGHARAFRPRRQELPPIVVESGGVYVARVSKILESGSRFPAPTKCVPISFLESLDIDTPEDLECAKKISDGLKKL